MATCSRVNACSMNGRSPVDGAANTARSGRGLPGKIGGGWLEELLGGPAGKHLFQDAAVIGVGQAAECSG